MSNIKILPEDLVSKIAAGEVVERPASVVKELLDNSLDARASQITIEIENGGINKILVIDNGTGMDKDDLQLAFKPHATSKINNIDDLLNIKSYGFRGEALSSIASVSKVTVKSRKNDSNTGYELKIEGGNQISLNETGCAVGTSIEIKDLFYNVPARKEFVRSDQAEYKAILQVVNAHAIANHTIGMNFINNNKSIYTLVKDQSLESRISDIVGKDNYSAMTPLFFEHPHLEIYGFTGKPEIASENPKNQYIFVNKRKINDKSISFAIKESYSSLIPKNYYPQYVLFIDVPPNIVDVNVHPRKEEVKFSNQNLIFSSVKTAVQKALDRANLTPGATTPKDPFASTNPFGKPDPLAPFGTQKPFGSTPFGSKATTPSPFGAKTKPFGTPLGSTYGGFGSPAPYNPGFKTPQNITTNPLGTVGTTDNNKAQQSNSNETPITSNPTVKNTIDLKDKDKKDLNSNPTDINANTANSDTTKDKTQGSINLTDNKDQDQKDIKPTSPITSTDPFTFPAGNSNKDPYKANQSSDPFAQMPYKDPFATNPYKDPYYDDFGMPKPYNFNDGYGDYGATYPGTSTQPIFGDMIYIQNLYIAVEGPNGLEIYDQHAVHERIIYERLLKNHLNKKENSDSQKLLTPIILNLSVDESDTIKQNLDKIEKSGIYLEEFGPNSYKITEVPTILAELDLKAIIRELIEDLENKEQIKDTDNQTDKILTYLACRSAYKAGDIIPDIEVEAMINQLETTEVKYTCPHGRPVKVEISIDELAKMFKRK